MISQSYLSENLDFIDLLLKGTINADFERPDAKAFDIKGELLAVSGETMVDFSRVPQDSTLVLPIHGPMLRYGGPCSWGMTDVAETLAHAAANRNVSAVLIDLDSPGGGVDAIAPVIQGIKAVKAAGKPIGVLFETMASAAVYGFSGADFVWANNDISAMFGSLGVMAVLKTQSEEDNKRRIVVYAPQSTEKNEPVELALSGDTKLFQEQILAPVAAKFIADFKKIRPQLVDDGHILAGRMYYASDALKLNAFDGIGTLPEALAELRKMASKKGSSASSGRANAQNQNANINMKYANLLAILALTTLEFSKGSVSLSNEQIEKLKAEHKKLSGKDLQLNNLKPDGEGFADFSEADLTSLETIFASLKASGTPPAQTPTAAPGADANQPTLETVLQEVSGLKAQVKKNDEVIAALGNKPVEVNLQELPKVIRMQEAGKREMMIANGFVFGEAHEWNKVDAKRPYNQALEARMRGDYNAEKVYAASEIDFDQITSDLGNFIAGRKGEIVEWFNPNDQLESAFPTLMGVKEGDFFMSVELQEVFQQYQKAWTPKGSYKFDSRKPVLRDIKFDLEFEDLKSIERTWLNEFNKEGSAAYKMTFVEYLVSLAIRRGVSEWNIAAVRGVYKAPTAGVAGKSINIADGILTQVAAFESELIAKPFYDMGEWTSANILDFVKNMIARIPEDMRDRPGLGFYVPTLFIQTYWEARRLAEGTMPVYDPRKTYIPGFDNIRLIPIPNAGNSKRVFIAPEGIIRQLFAENGNNNTGLINVEKSKRVINIFGDFKRNIWPTVVGAKAENASALADRDYSYQLIWYNDADYASTDFLTVDADATVLSAKLHTNLLTSANSAATAITNITDAVTGDMVTVKCGSTTNASTIANSGNFDLAAAWSPTAVGHYIRLIKRGDGKWVEYDRYSGVTPTEFTADDATPDVASGTVFITNDANTVATAITKLDNAVSGTEYTIYGGGGTNAATMADGTYLRLSAAWTGAALSWIRLKCNASGVCVEIARSE